MEEVGQEGPILSIFLCEFHSKRGPIIVCQYPENFICKEVFEAISVYLIPKPQIQKRIITVSVFGLKISGYPNAIKNEQKYERNDLIFNLCFVCGSKSRTVQYEPVVKKLSEYLENLELENEFLSNEESKQQLPGILGQILHEMNSSGKCTVKILIHDHQLNERRMSYRKPPEIEFGKPHGGLQERRYSITSDRKKMENPPKQLKKNFDLPENKEKQGDNSSNSSSEENIPYVSVLNLKQVVGVRPDPIQIQDHHVPILNCSRGEITRVGHHWDLTTQQVLPYIDGLSHIAKIAAEADVDNNLVKACVQNLVYYKVVKLLPIFQYTNVYTALPGLHKLYTTKQLQEECLRTVCKSQTARMPNLASIMQLYSSFTYSVSVRDLCLRFNPQAQNIDERKLIQFGLLHEFIRRLHQYPVFQTSSDDILTTNLNSGAVGSFHKMCNGFHTIDEICCKFSMTYQEVNDRLERDSNVIIILK